MSWMPGKQQQAEFTSSSGGDEETFWELFQATGNAHDTVPSKTVTARVKHAHIAATSHAYNKWLRPVGCETSKNIKLDGKTVSCITGLKHRDNDQVVIPYID